MTPEAWKEQAARIIDPSSWAVMDGYLKQMLRQYKGKHIGYDPEAFKHKESMAIAEALWPLVQQAIAAERGEVENARDILSGLSSYLGAGLGDDATTLKQFDERIRWGIDHIGSVYRNRAAQVVEECSKRPRTTWGEVKRAIMDDTTLPTAASTDHEATIAQLRDRVAGLEEIPSHIAEQVLSMGRAEWGATSEKTSAEHLADFENTLRLTRENFNLEDIPVQMHGLYLEGAETILCHTGTSPNSGANAQALMGVWNWLYDQCKARALLTQNEVG